MTTVALSVVFERFPASVRGAVLARGLDGDPHHVALTDVRAVEAADPSRARASIDLGSVVVDVTPRGEVVVPFDLPFASLQPGWFRIEVDGVVDGQQRVHGPSEGKTFLVPWPSEEVRRGQIPIDRRLDVGGSEIHLDRIECKTDRAVVRWRGEADAEIRVLVGRQRVPALERPEGSGAERATVVYPILRRYRALTFEGERGGRRTSTTVELA